MSQLSRTKRKLKGGKRSALCHWCGREFGVKELTMDHLVPQCIGGSHEEANIVLSCQPCNVARAAKWQNRIAFAIRLPAAELDARWAEFSDAFKQLAMAAQVMQSRRLAFTHSPLG